MTTIEKGRISIYFPNFPNIDESPILKPKLVDFTMSSFINPFTENNSKLREIQNALDYQIIIGTIGRVEFVLPSLKSDAQRPSFELPLSSPEIKIPNEYVSDRGIIRIMKSLELNSQHQLEGKNLVLTRVSELAIQRYESFGKEGPKSSREFSFNEHLIREFKGIFRTIGYSSSNTKAWKDLALELELLK